MYLRKKYTLQIKYIFKKDKTLGKHRRSGKEKNSLKKIMLTVFRDLKGPITLDFLEKDAIINSASNFKGNIHLIYRMTLI